MQKSFTDYSQLQNSVMPFSLINATINNQSQLIAPEVDIHSQQSIDDYNQLSSQMRSNVQKYQSQYEEIDVEELQEFEKPERKCVTFIDSVQSSVPMYVSTMQENDIILSDVQENSVLRSQKLLNSQEQIEKSIYISKISPKKQSPSLQESKKKENSEDLSEEVDRICVSLFNEAEKTQLDLNQIKSSVQKMIKKDEPKENPIPKQILKKEQKSAKSILKPQLFTQSLNLKQNYEIPHFSVQKTVYQFKTIRFFQVKDVKQEINEQQQQFLLPKPEQKFYDEQINFKRRVLEPSDQVKSKWDFIKMENVQKVGIGLK